MAEWSKAGDSSSLLFGGVGSNPTPVTTRKTNARALLFFRAATRPQRRVCSSEVEHRIADPAVASSILVAP